MTQPASGFEEPFWVAEELAPGAPANVSYQLIQLEGPLDVSSLAKAYRAVVNRHEALRTAFGYQDGALKRNVSRGAGIADPIRVSPEPTSDEIINALLKPPFRLASGDLIRIGVQPWPNGAMLHVVVHHIAYDGLSHEVFANDLAYAYAAVLRGRDIDLAVRRRLPAANVSQMRRDDLIEHWRTVLTDVRDLPGLGGKPHFWDLAEARLVERRNEYDASTVTRVRSVARRLRVTPSVLLLTAYGQALTSVGGVDGYCVGIPLAVRQGAYIDEVGCHVNVVPVQISGPPGPEAVQRIWRAQLDAMSYSDLPLPQIVSAAQVPAGARAPLVQTSMFYQGWKRPVYEHAPVRMRTSRSSPLGVPVEVQAQVCADDDQNIDVRLQAPTTSGWCEKLDDLVGRFDECLDGLITEVM